MMKRSSYLLLIVYEMCILIFVLVFGNFFSFSVFLLFLRENPSNVFHVCDETVFELVDYVLRWLFIIIHIYLLSTGTYMILHKIYGWSGDSKQSGDESRETHEHRPPSYRDEG